MSGGDGTPTCDLPLIRSVCGLSDKRASATYHYNIYHEQYGLDNPRRDKNVQENRQEPNDCEVQRILLQLVPHGGLDKNEWSGHQITTNVVMSTRAVGNEAVHHGVMNM